MSKPLNVYDMAEKGVVTSRSPYHLEDGELVKAQNWQTDPTLADGCIRRRDGMAKLNTTAMAGSVKGLIALPLPDQFTVLRTFYAPIDDATTNTWRISTNGSAWSTITTSTLNKAARTAHSNSVSGVFSTSIRGAMPWIANVNHKMYFPGDDYVSTEDGGTVTQPTLYVWDGTTSTKLLTTPRSPHSSVDSQAIISLIPYSQDEIIVTVHDQDTGTGIVHGRVLLYNLTTTELVQLGPATDLRGSPIAVGVYQGRIWVVPANFTAETMNVMWLRPGDAAWTVDAALPAASIGGVALCEFQGNLFLGTHSSTATDATIRKRLTSTAAWTTSLQLDGSGLGQEAGPMIVTADGLKLISYYNNADGTAPVTRFVSTTDGITWVTDLDLPAILGAGYVVPGYPYLDSDGSIYWPLRKSDDTGFILKRTSAGVWSTVDTFTALRGPLPVLNTVI